MRKREELNFGISRSGSKVTNIGMSCNQPIKIEVGEFGQAGQPQDPYPAPYWSAEATKIKGWDLQNLPIVWQQMSLRKR